jgi:hypothetical protein
MSGFTLGMNFQFGPTSAAHFAALADSRQTGVGVLLVLGA